jgi:hypothetical protein
MEMSSSRSCSDLSMNLDVELGTLPVPYIPPVLGVFILPANAAAPADKDLLLGEPVIGVFFTLRVDVGVDSKWYCVKNASLPMPFTAESFMTAPLTHKDLCKIIFFESIYYTDSKLSKSILLPPTEAVVKVISTIYT